MDKEKQYSRKRIVVKVGSNVLTRTDGTLDVTRMSGLVDQIVMLRRMDYEIILVSSGAVASGKGEIKVDHKLASVEQRQLFSAVGQVKLINLYYELFREYNLNVGQVLTMKESFSTRREYLNQRSCMNVMLQNDVIPIVNENDTISVTELMFTDNDELSGLIASMMDADALIILSNIDGIYDGAPSDSSSKVIRIIDHKKDLSNYIQTEKSGFGRGGMVTKCNIARKVADEGIKVIIANGKRDNILVDLVKKPGDTLHTEFIPNKEDVSSVKKWIAHSAGFAKGMIFVNDCFKRILDENKAVSILPIGVTRIEGEFEKDDIVRIMDSEENEIGVGRVGFSSEQAAKLIGQRGKKPIVHYDYLYIE
jgi:glutamate 5-kinase